MGEAGVGKSRLFYEFTHSHRVQGWFILESGSVSYGKATAYLPVVDLLKGYFKIQDRDDQREIRDKVIGRVLGLDRSLEPLLPPVLALLDVPVDDPVWAALDPPQRRQRTLDAVKRLLLRESQVQPLMMVIEDLHWIDSETQALLDSLVDSLGSIRLLLLVNYRPEYEHRWGKQDLLHPAPPRQPAAGEHGRAAPRPPGRCPRTRAAEADAPPARQSLLPRGDRAHARGNEGLRRRAGGVSADAAGAEPANPGDRTGDPGGADRPAADGGQAAPANRLGHRQGRPFAILTAIAELPEETLRRSLGHLQEAEFLYETTLFPDLEYTFKHALTHEVTYGSLLHERRRTLHARIVEAIEALYPDRAEPNTSTGWPTMRFAASCGRRPRLLPCRPVPGRSRARRTAEAVIVP